MSFQYELTASYGSTITAAQSPLVASASGAAVSSAVTGLSCGTTYHFRGVATNSAGTTNGSDATFTTTACAPGAFAKSSPGDAATGVASNPTLSWGASANAASYEYCCDTANDNACTNWVSTVANTTATFTVILSNASGVALGTPSTTTVTIADDDTPPTVQFSTSEVSVNDTVGTVTFTVTRLSRATTTASVKYATANGTAIAGTDYAAKTGTLSWAAGDATAKTFTVSIKNRSGTQAPRSFTVNLNTPTNVGVGTPATETVTIVN